MANVMQYKCLDTSFGNISGQGILLGLYNMCYKILISSETKKKKSNFFSNFEDEKNE